jgi:hypothetical protein
MLHGSVVAILGMFLVCQLLEKIRDLIGCGECVGILPRNQFTKPKSACAVQRVLSYIQL